MYKEAYDKRAPDDVKVFGRVRGGVGPGRNSFNCYKVLVILVLSIFISAEWINNVLAATIKVTASPAAIPVNGSTTTTITALVYDNSGLPMAGETINFITSIGELSEPSAVTRPDGKAFVTLRVYPVEPPESIEGVAAIVKASAAGAEDSVRVGLFNSPHGKYASNTNACSVCHGIHSVTSPRLLKQSVEPPSGSLPVVAPLCFTCHDGTGAISNTKAAFSDASGNVSYHPVMGTGNLLVTPLINCTACHNVHGDKKPAPEKGVYPMLLRQINWSAGGIKVFGGPEFCLTCHGPDDRKWGGNPGEPGYYDYYSFTGGDHSAPNAVHNSTDYVDPDTGIRPMDPPSGTGVTCIRCHDQHASGSRWLLARNSASHGEVPLGGADPGNGEEEVCFQCHSSRVMPRSDIEMEFNGPGVVSRHDVYGVTGAQLECTSCHGPHSVTKTEKVSDPQNTKLTFPFTIAGNPSAFCLRCHGPNPPRENFDALNVVPYSVLWPSLEVTTNGSGYDKDSVWGSSTKSDDPNGCALCHVPRSHASNNPNLLSFNEENPVCMNCHADVYAETDPTVLGVVYNDYSYFHPVQQVNGMHENIENYANMPLAGRHAECSDCHDPHAANRVKSGSRSSGAPAILSTLRNASGVGVINGAPGSKPQYIFKRSADYEYEVCFKCHSAYSWGSQGPPLLSYGSQGDPSVEFNPNNASYHPVETEGKNLYISAASFTNGWDAFRKTYCSDCHGSSPGGKGPHGSSNRHILQYPYTAGPGPVAANELCFKCHQSFVYKDGGDSAEPASRFFGTVAGQPGVSLHGLHVGQQGSSCWNCHAEHGSAQYPRLLIADQTRGISSLDLTDPANPSCTAGCHSVPAPYTWTPAY